MAKFNVGDHVRVVRSDLWDNEAGRGAEGVVVSYDGGWDGFPILVEITKWGVDLGTRLPFSIPFGYAEYELELIEKAPIETSVIEGPMTYEIDDFVDVVDIRISGQSLLDRIQAMIPVSADLPNIRVTIERLPKPATESEGDAG